MFVDMLRGFRFESLRDSFVQCISLLNKAWRDQTAWRLHVTESTLQHLELSTLPKSHCMFDNYVYVAFCIQEGLWKNLSFPTHLSPLYLFHTNYTMRLFRTRAVGRGWLIADLLPEYHMHFRNLCRTAARELWQMVLLENWRTKRSGQSACARNDDRFSEQLSVLCMTYLGWVGTYKAQSCRHAASTLLERSPLIEPPLVRTFVLQMLPN